MADNISDIVAVNITGSSPGLTQAAFNTTLFACYHTHSPSRRVLSYSSVSSMVSDGWATTESGYQAATAYFSQNPSPSLLKIGRLSTAVTHTVTLTVLDATAGARYALQLASNAPVAYTVGSSMTTTTVAAALVTALGTLVGYTIASSGAVITVTNSPGLLVNLSGWSKNLYVADATTDAGELLADLAAIDAEDDNWYGLDIDTASKVKVLVAAAWVEANGKLFTPRSFDSAVKDSVATTDVASSAQTSAYTRTAIMFSGSGTTNFSGMAWQGKLFPYDPGTENWAFKTLAGIPADSLTAGERLAIETKGASCYSTRKGVNITQFGKTASGSWIDFTRGLDWLKEDMQTRVYSLFLSNNKVPFNDVGIAMVRMCVTSALEDAAGRDFINDGYSITVQKAASLNPTAKTSRILPSGAITWQAVSAGAMNGTTINGTVS
jgi:hypothetical protein